MLRKSLLLLPCAILILVSGQDNIPAKPLGPPSYDVKNYTVSNTTTTTTTTPKPAPVTTPAVVTTSTPVIPTPKPNPEVSKWVLRRPDNNYTCIIVKMSGEFDLSMKMKNKTMEAKLNLPPVNETLVRGTCDDKNNSLAQQMVISWNSKAVNKSNSLTLNFLKLKEKDHYELENLVVSIDPSDLPSNYSSNETLIAKHVKEQYHTVLSKSYRCLQEQKLDLIMPANNESVGFITVEKLQFQAFMNTTTDKFSSAQDCSFITPDYVPITVGFALASFIIIILTIYLVGRRRSQARGYLSM